MGKITVDADKCRGCQICELTCSFTKLGVFAPSRALMKVVHEYPAKERPVVCIQCEDAPCAEACPTNAITKTETGAWIVNEEACNGCGLCVESCPYGVVKMNPESGVAMKCDFCGGDPECVKMCSVAALRYESASIGANVKSQNTSVEGDP